MSCYEYIIAVHGFFSETLTWTLARASWPATPANLSSLDRSGQAKRFYLSLAWC